MNIFLWVLGYILIGIIASTVHIRLEYKFDRYALAYFPTFLIGAIGIFYFCGFAVYLIFDIVPDKLDDLITLIFEK